MAKPKPIDFKCPDYPATPGKPCRSSRGNPLPTCHTRRVYAAQDAYAKSKAKKESVVEHDCGKWTYYGGMASCPHGYEQLPSGESRRPSKSKWERHRARVENLRKTMGEMKRLAGMDPDGTMYIKVTDHKVKGDVLSYLGNKQSFYSLSRLGKYKGIYKASEEEIRTMRQDRHLKGKWAIIRPPYDDITASR